MGIFSAFLAGAFIWAAATDDPQSISRHPVPPDQIRYSVEGLCLQEIIGVDYYVVRSTGTVQFQDVRIGARTVPGSAERIRQLIGPAYLLKISPMNCQRGADGKTRVKLLLTLMSSAKGQDRTMAKTIELE